MAHLSFFQNLAFVELPTSEDSAHATWQKKNKDKSSKEIEAPKSSQLQEEGAMFVPAKTKTKSNNGNFIRTKNYVEAFAVDAFKEFCLHTLCD